MRILSRGWACVALALLLAGCSSPPTESRGDSPAPVPDASVTSRVAEVQRLVDDEEPEEAESATRGLLAEVESNFGKKSIEVAVVLDALVRILADKPESDDLETIEFAKRAVAIKTKAFGDESVELAVSLGHLGRLFYAQENLLEAREPLERALRLEEQKQPVDARMVAARQRDLANLLVDVGEYAAAEELYEQEAKFVEEQTGETIELAGIFYNRARLLVRTGDYNRALTLYDRARQIAIGVYEDPRHPMVAYVLNGMAIVNEVLGEYTRSRGLYEEALSIWESAFEPDNYLIRGCSNNLALVLLELGELDLAATYLRRAVTEALEHDGPKHLRTARYQRNLGRALQALGNLDDAEELFRQSLATRTELLPPDAADIGMSHHGLGQLLAERGRLTESEEHFRSALAIWVESLPPENPHFGMTNSGLARTLAMSGNQAEARELYAEALGNTEASLGGDHPTTGKLLGELSSVSAALGDYSLAVEQAIRAERIARDHFRSISQGLSEREALDFLTVKTSGLGSALALLADGHAVEHVDRVWDAVVASRALVFDEMAGRRRMAGGAQDAEVAKLLDELESASRVLANLLVRGNQVEDVTAYRQLVTDARRAREEIERQLGERSDEFRRSTQERRVDLDDVLSRLPEDAALVAYVRYDRSAISDQPMSEATGRYLAFVKARADRSTEVVDLGSAVEVEQLRQDWYQEAATGVIRRGQGSPIAETAYRRVGRELRRAIWDPVHSIIEPTGRVVVVPAGALHMVSVQSLPDDAESYLVESGPLIDYVTTERDLVTRISVAEPQRELLVVGDPAFDKLNTADTEPSVAGKTSVRGSTSLCTAIQSERFERLPATNDEARRVLELWNQEKRGSSELRKLTGDLASEAAVKRLAPGSRVLHFATHGFFVDSICQPDASESPHSREDSSTERISPLALSGLVLAGANHRADAGEGEEDGILTAEEIGAMDLSSVDWAVLSACDTGAGRLKVGEGVLGLQRAFRIAGARVVIMNLWQVEDRAGRDWMSALYAAHLSSDLHTAEAVREASLDVLRRNRTLGLGGHPFYWGGWVATGG